MRRSRVASSRRRPTSGDLPWSPQEWTNIGLSLSDHAPIHAGQVTARAGAAPGFDMHFALEMGVVLSGEMRRYWRSWQTDLGVGQVWFCGIWERHGWEVLTPTCRHLVLVLLPQALLRARFEEAPGMDWMAPFMVAPHQRPQAKGQQKRELTATVERFEELIAPGSRERPASLELLVLELLLTVLDGWASPSRRRLSWLELHYEAVNRAVETALRAHRPVATAEAARASGMSGRAFTRAFEGLMGISFSKFALRSRLSSAAAQLREGGASVSEVAAEWGFGDAGRLQRLFREHYQTPLIAER
ncbi:MAG: helix-turn-helix transcriptional regulator [Armatimonadota bacterium]